ncbi:HEC/Ndc80p family-domain-containing protein [Phycomyces nitens]|nr:HEC/Ndc80p family-domain-containing protein [Phycomyces nitens]
MSQPIRKDLDKVTRRFTIAHAESSQRQSNSASKRSIPAVNEANKIHRSSAEKRLDHDLVGSLGPQRIINHELSPSLSTRRTTITTLPASQSKLPELTQETLHESILVFNKGSQGAVQKLHIDPRPIKDGEFQRKEIKTIIDYLTRTRYKDKVTPKTLRELSNKNFQNIFKWLNYRIQPKYIYTQPVFEEEAISLLKALGYPLVDSINQKELFSIGAPHYLPTIWAILLWMVELCEIYDLDREEEFTSTKVDMTFNPMDPELLQSIFYDYSIQCYNMFMDGKNETLEADIQLQECFELLEKRTEEVEEITRMHLEQLENEVYEMKDEEDPLASLQTIQEKLKRELQRHVDFQITQGKKIKKYEELMSSSEDNKAIIEKELETRRVKRDNLRKQIEAQNVSEERVAQLAQERLTLENDYNITHTRLLDIQKKEFEASQAVESEKAEVSMDISEYNKQATDARLIPSDGFYANGENYRVELYLEGETMDSILSQNLEMDIKPRLLALHKELQDTVLINKEKLIHFKNEFEMKKKEFDDSKEDVKDLEEQYSQKKQEYEKARKLSNKEISHRNQEIEEYENKTKSTRANALSELMMTKQKHSQLSLDLEALVIQHSTQEEKARYALNMSWNNYKNLAGHLDSSAEEYTERAQRHCNTMRNL